MISNDRDSPAASSYSAFMANSAAQADVTSLANAENTYRKRARIKYACLPCRQKKMKCDRKQPCAACTAKNQLCVFERSEKTNRMRTLSDPDPKLNVNSTKNLSTSDDQMLLTANTFPDNDKRQSDQVQQPFVPLESRRDTAIGGNTADPAALLKILEARLERMERLLSRQESELSLPDEIPSTSAQARNIFNPVFDTTLPKSPRINRIQALERDAVEEILDYPFDISSHNSAFPSAYEGSAARSESLSLPNNGLQQNEAGRSSQGQGSQNEKLEILTEICATLPSLHTTRILVEVYKSNAKCMAGHFVHLPSLLDAIEEFYSVRGADAYLKDQEMAHHIFSKGHEGIAWLAGLLIILCFGLQYLASPFDDIGFVAAIGELKSDLFPQKNLQDHILEEEVNVLSQSWEYSAINCVHLADYTRVASIETIQACLLLVVFSTTGKSVSSSSLRGDFIASVVARREGERDLESLGFLYEDEAPKEQKDGLLLSSVSLLRTSIGHAQMLKMHLIPSTACTIKDEISRRIWWALCFREWTYCSGDILSRMPMIRLGEFTTSFPLNKSDEEIALIENADFGGYNERYGDLDISLTPSQDTRYTEMTFVRTMLRYGCLVQEQNENIIRFSLDNGQDSNTSEEAQATAKMITRYKSFAETLPFFFYASTPTSGLDYACTALDVQKWFLQSAIFSRLMQIYRHTLWSDDIGREMCAEAARSILTLQQDIRGKSAVVDSQWTNLAQSYSAAVVLCEDFLVSISLGKQHSISASDLKMINEAILALMQISSEDPTASRCAHILQMLLQNVRHREGQQSSGFSSTNQRNSVINLIRRIERSAPVTSRYTVKNDMPTNRKRPAYTANGVDITLKYPNKMNQFSPFSRKPQVPGNGDITKMNSSTTAVRAASSGVFGRNSCNFSDTSERNAVGLTIDNYETLSNDNLINSAWDWLYSQGQL